jgi:hypothetical protein
VDQRNEPRTLWLIFASIGVATIIGLLIYNKVFGKKGGIGGGEGDDDDNEEKPDSDKDDEDA